MNDRFPTSRRAVICMVALATASCSSRAVESTGASGEAISASPPAWAGWENLQGGLITDPVIVSDDQSRLQVYATAPGGTVWERTYQPAIHLGAWASNWVSLGNKGNAVGAPSAVTTPSGLSEIFVRDSVTGHLLHQEGRPSSTGVPMWNAAGWEDLGGSLALGKPTVVVSQPGNQVNVFATMTDNSVQTIAVQAYGTHGPWVSLAGGALYEPGVTSWGPDRLDVFVAGGDHGLYHRYSNDNGTTWYPAGTKWEDVGGSVGATPSVTSWATGRLDIVTTSPAGAIEHLAWLGPAWSAWSVIPGTAWTDPTNGAAAPTSLSTGAGNLNVFIQEENRALYVASVTGTDAAGNPSWSPFTQFASCFITAGSASVVSPDNVSLDVAVTAFDPSGNANVWHAVTTGSALTFSGIGSTSPPACPCGADGGPCCDNDTCNGGTNAECTVTTTNINGPPSCVALGGSGDPCRPQTCPAGSSCTPPPACDPFNECDGTTCVQCGGLGQVECQGTVQCIGGGVPTPVSGQTGLWCEPPCGTQLGGVCCENFLMFEGDEVPYPTCSGGMTCNHYSNAEALDNGVCVECGHEGELCCDAWTSPTEKGTCSDGSTCNSATPAMCTGSGSGGCATQFSPYTNQWSSESPIAANEDFSVSFVLGNSGCEARTVQGYGFVTSAADGKVTPTATTSFTLGAYPATENLSLSFNLPAGSYAVSFQIVGFAVEDYTAGLCVGGAAAGCGGE